MDAERSQWQPIETAPKDGTRILGYDGDHVAVTYSGIWPGPAEWHDESVVGEEYGAVFHAKWKPTLWMPLPEPPK